MIIGLSISMIMVGAYAAVGFAKSSSKVVWSTNPVNIVLSGSSGSVTESVKCAPKTVDVVLKAGVSNPTKISLAADQFPDGECGPSPGVITLVAHCLVAPPTCKGTFTGTIIAYQGYSTIPPSLVVKIIVI